MKMFNKNSNIGQCIKNVDYDATIGCFLRVETTFGRLIWATFAQLSLLLQDYIHPPTTAQPDVHLRLIWTRLIVIEVFSSDSLLA